MRKNPSLCEWLHRDSNSRPNVRRFRGYKLNHRGDRLEERDFEKNRHVCGGEVEVEVVMITPPCLEISFCRAGSAPTRWSSRAGRLWQSDWSSSPARPWEGGHSLREKNALGFHTGKVHMPRDLPTMSSTSWVTLCFFKSITLLIGACCRGRGDSVGTPSRLCDGVWVVQRLGGRGYDDSVPGEITKTVPSGNRTTWSPTWSANLPRIQLIPLEGWSIISPGGAIFVPSPKTGINLRHPRPPQSLNDFAALAEVTMDQFICASLFHTHYCWWIWSRETGLAVPSRVSLLISILRLNLVVTYGILPEFRGGVHLLI